MFKYANSYTFNVHYLVFLILNQIDFFFLSSIYSRVTNENVCTIHPSMHGHLEHAFLRIHIFHFL